MKTLIIAFMMLPAYSFCQNATTNETNNTSTSNAAQVQTINIKNDRKGLPVYLFNGTGSGSIIGFMFNGTFRKVRAEEYDELCVQKYARDLLENEDNFKTWLRVQYGAYCVAVR